MPKRKDSEGKKPKKSSAAKERLASSPGHMEILPPPNPSATHLVATNPFDDPVQTPMKMHPMHPNYQGQPMNSMMRLQGPNSGMNVGYGRGMRPPYNGSNIPPSWSNPMHSSGMMGPNPVSYHPNLPPNANGYPMGRPPYGMPMYRNTSRVMRPVMHGSMGPDGMGDALGMPGMGHMGPSPMTALARPPTQMPSPLGGRRGSSSSKGESKSPKGSEGGSKRKKSEKKAMAENRLKNQNELEKQTLMDQSLPLSMSNPIPMVGVLCKKCNIEINGESDQVVQCVASCNSWFHRNCVGLTEAAYSLLRAESCAIWACDHCLQTKEIYSVRNKMPSNMPMVANA